MNERAMTPEIWDFETIYGYPTKEDAVRAAERARNAGFKAEFVTTKDADYKYGFMLIDPFEYLED